MPIELRYPQLTELLLWSGYTGGCFMKTSRF